MSKTMLVTGGAGFIGSNFVFMALEQTDYSIIVVDKLTYAGDAQTLEPILEKIEFITGDICDQKLIDDLVGRSDIVVHFAAESHVDNSLDDPSPFMESNIMGTFRILEACRKHGVRLHHISTDEVYGDLELDSNEKFTEDTPYDPSSPYSSTKAGSDMLVRAWVRSYGIEATISNCSNNYGPRQHIEKSIPRQITNVLTGLPMKLYGEGLNVRDWIHVDDHNDAVLTIIEKGKNGETYLIGSNGEMANRDVFAVIAKLMDVDPNTIERVTDRAGHDLRYAIDNSKIVKELGWQPKYASFEEGLKNTIEWYKANEDWWRPQKEEIEKKYAEKGQ